MSTFWLVYFVCMFLTLSAFLTVCYFSHREGDDLELGPLLSGLLCFVPIVNAFVLFVMVYTGIHAVSDKVIIKGKSL